MTDVTVDLITLAEAQVTPVATNRSTRSGGDFDTARLRGSHSLQHVSTWEISPPKVSEDSECHQIL